MTALPIHTISVGKPNEKPLVMFCGWAVPCSCAWSRVSNTEAPVVLRSQLGCRWVVSQLASSHDFWPGVLLAGLAAQELNVWLG